MDNDSELRSCERTRPTRFAVPQAKRVDASTRPTRRHEEGHRGGRRRPPLRPAEKNVLLPRTWRRLSWPSAADLVKDAGGLHWSTEASREERRHVEGHRGVQACDYTEVWSPTVGQRSNRKRTTPRTGCTQDIVEKNIVEVPRLKTYGHSSSSSSPSGARRLARPQEATVCQEQSPGNTAGKDYR